jgi:uncharacterized peroxidase-related enzyme
MTFIETIPPERAEGAAAEIYDADRETYGHVPNFTQAFSHRPDVYAAWQRLNGTLKAGMDLRRYELVTIAAARRLHSSYCMLAHGSVLAARFLAADAVRAVVADHRSAGLADIDVAIMDLAEKLADDATSVTQADIDRLRGLGLSDGDITNVVLAAAARCFFSKALDALGAQADSKYATSLDAGLRDTLVVGRPIEPE